MRLFYRMEQQLLIARFVIRLVQNVRDYQQIVWSVLRLERMHQSVLVWMVIMI
jgi:hypothetical protein